MGKIRTKDYVWAFLQLLCCFLYRFLLMRLKLKVMGKQLRTMEEENKTVRVGYFPYANFQEGSSGEHKQGVGL